MKPRYAILVILAVISFVAFAQAQENKEQTEKPQAYIFAKVGKANNNKFKKQMDGFLVKLRQVSDSQGYIINYGTDQEIAYRERQIRNYIIWWCGFRPTTTLVRGGNNGELKTVFWIVLPGAENPKP